MLPRLVRWLFLVGLVLTGSETTAQAAQKSMTVLDIERGQMPNDIGGQCSVSLSELHTAAGSGISLKMAFRERGRGWVGQYNLKRKDWTGFTKLSFYLHSSLKRSTVMTFVVKDSRSTVRAEWAVVPFEVKPGGRHYSLDISQLRSQSGRKLEITSLRQWHFSYRFFPEANWEESGEEAATFHLSALCLSAEH